MINTFLAYNLVTRDMGKSINRIEKEPVVTRETAYYLENIGKVKSIDDLMKDHRLYTYAMKAHGLEDMAYAKAFIRKALTEGIADPNSFANKLSDKRYHDFVETFNFEAHGEVTTIFKSTTQGVVDKYMRQTLEENEGKQNEGVRLALYFERKIGQVDSFYGILADPALGKVVRTVLGMPDSFATADIDRQVAFFESKLDLDSLKEPEGFKKFMTRFTAMWEINNGSTMQHSPIASLFSNTPQYGVSTNLMLAIQQMKR